MKGTKGKKGKRPHMMGLQTANAGYEFDSSLGPFQTSNKKGAQAHTEYNQELVTLSNLDD
jgi:hypothetical protein